MYVSGVTKTERVRERERERDRDRERFVCTETRRFSCYVKFAEAVRFLNT